MLEVLAKNLLLTGPPGCGKTTVIRRLVERLANRRVAGFYTHEIRKKGQRVGFEVRGLNGGARHPGSCRIPEQPPCRSIRRGPGGFRADRS